MHAHPLKQMTIHFPQHLENVGMMKMQPQIIVLIAVISTKIIKDNLRIADEDIPKNVVKCSL